MEKLQEIAGELKAINAQLDAMDSKIAAMDSKIDALRNESKSEIKRVDEKVDGLSSQFETQRMLLILEAKVTELEKRFVVKEARSS